MDQSFKFPSPGTPLHPISPERVNQQRQSLYEDSPTSSVHGRHLRESSVHEKVAAFNSISMGFQGKSAERKVADAALNRAMLGREEAESQLRRYKDDVKLLRRQVEDGKEREKRVGERLETVMENYGRAKETHAHTQTLWEKEIRRARKENFKSQSVLVKLQEELKYSRETAKRSSAELEEEKERSTKREQEAFAARYQLVGVQEELATIQEKIKSVEQERDALRTIAMNEEITRIAAEGQIPLPASQEDDEFASPKKARKSLDPITVISSAASEEELEDIRLLLQWEQQRANRAHDRVEFLEVECRLNCCASRASRAAPENAGPASMKQASTIFIPSEGVFRTVSPVPEESPWISPAKKTLPPLFQQQNYQETPSIARQQSTQVVQDTRSFARTPSCEPPAPALIAEVNTSLLSLLDAPHSPTRTEDGNNDNDDDEDQNPTPTQARVLHEPARSPAPEYTIHTISTTTRIPLANPPDLTPPTVLPVSSSHPALSPTMSREEALAQIRERRGRARSLAQGTLTPRKQMVEGADRRDISAPAIRSGNVRGRLASRT